MVYPLCSEPDPMMTWSARSICASILEDNTLNDLILTNPPPKKK